MALPRKGRPNSGAHVDTNILLRCFNPTEEDERRAASSLLRGTGGTVSVSIIVVGEFLRRLINLEQSGGLNEAEFSGALRGFQTAVSKGNINCLQGEADHWQVNKILPRVMGEAPEHMQQNDGLIVAYAILDKHCKVLYSEDGDMIGSMHFTDYVRDEFSVDIQPLQR